MWLTRTRSGTCRPVGHWDRLEKGADLGRRDADLAGAPALELLHQELLADLAPELLADLGKWLPIERLHLLLAADLLRELADAPV